MKGASQIFKLLASEDDTKIVSRIEDIGNTLGANV